MFQVDAGDESQRSHIAATLAVTMASREPGIRHHSWFDFQHFAMAPKEESKAPERQGCSARSERLKKPALSYIGQLVKAMQEGIW